MAAKSFLLKIVTPQQLFYSGEVEMVVVEQGSGQEGYMAGHSPALKRLEKGEVKIREAEGKEPRIVQIPGAISTWERPWQSIPDMPAGRRRNKSRVHACEIKKRRADIIQYVSCAPF